MLLKYLSYDLGFILDSILFFILFVSNSNAIFSFTSKKVGIVGFMMRIPYVPA